MSVRELNRLLATSKRIHCGAAKGRYGSVALLYNTEASLYYVLRWTDSRFVGISYVRLDAAEQTYAEYKRLSMDRLMNAGLVTTYSSL